MPMRQVYHPFTLTNIDILFPDIHMLMLITPWSWDPATEDIQAQTSSRLASAPGWVGAEVVEVDIPDTRAALQASSNRDMVMVESVCFLQRKTQQSVRHVIRRLYL